MTALVIFKWVLGLAMVGIGVTHFTAPRGFVKIVPKWLPAPGALVAISGVFEILGGVAEGETVVTNGNFLIDSESRLRAAIEGQTTPTPTTAPAPQHAH